jgi:hypothetical protein
MRHCLIRLSPRSQQCAIFHILLAVLVVQGVRARASSGEREDASVGGWSKQDQTECDVERVIGSCRHKQ